MMMDMKENKIQKKFRGSQQVTQAPAPAPAPAHTASQANEIGDICFPGSILSACDDVFDV